MDQETFRKYLVDRYEDQINWYGAKAGRNKRIYQWFQWGVIVLASILPVLIALPEEYQFEYHRLVTILVSVMLAIGTAAVKTFKFQENWTNYRTTSEALRKEKYFYDAVVGSYGSANDREALFVERVESIISGENTVWFTDQKSPPA